MNIVGKILVFLNLVFALAVGGFLILDFATRTNWAKQYEALKKELDVARSNAGTASETMAKDNNAAKKFKAEVESLQQQLIDLQDERKAIETSAKADKAEAERRAMEADLNAQKFLAETNRLKDEVKTQLDVIKQRDDVIVKQQKDVIDYRNFGAQQENQRKATQDRLEQALVRVQELTAALQKSTTGSANDKTAKGRPKSNPPAEYVEGKVVRIEGNLVEVTVGSDKGVNKDHTLEVFRMDPPAYLGVIRILDARPHSSVGRFERSGAVDRGPVRPGDTVATSLSR